MSSYSLCSISHGMNDADEPHTHIHTNTHTHTHTHAGISQDIEADTSLLSLMLKQGNERAISEVCVCLCVCERVRK